jgi:Tfp pilus assembly pilus retraction ATPase PilT
MEEWNRTRACRILSLEDPIEYLFSDKRASIVQRELGTDFTDKATGLSHAMGDGADVVFLSSLDKREDLDWALNLSESGVLVLSTVQSETCQGALEFLAGLVPQSSRLPYLERISRSLTLSTCQVLVPTKTGGRIAVRESLKVDPGARNLIRENNLLSLLPYMHQTIEGGTVSFHRQFQRFLNEGVIELQEVIDLIPDHQTFLARYQGQSTI